MQCFFFPEKKKLPAKKPKTTQKLPEKDCFSPRRFSKIYTRETKNSAREKKFKIVLEKTTKCPKKIKKSGREISKMGEKTAKKAGKSGRESRFLPEKKAKIRPKNCFSPTFAVSTPKKKHWHLRCVVHLNMN